MRPLLLFAFAIAFTGACASTVIPDECPSYTFERSVHVSRLDQLDLLFAIDGSASMTDERATMATELPRLVRILASGDRDEDGTADFTPIRSLHVGVIDTDLGQGGGAGCEGSGSEGRMRRTATRADCEAAYPSHVFEFGLASSDPARFARDVGCVADVGTGGCGVEQPLEAILRALSPASPTADVASFYDPPVFEGGTLGLGDGDNEGFLRARSMLAVVLITDEDDCSHSGTLEPSGEADPIRGCGGAELYPTSRYVSGLLQLRENPGLLVFAVIAGVPEDLPASEAIYESMLDDPRMTERIEPVTGELVPSCDSPGGRGTPPRRLVEVLRGLRDSGAGTTVQSSCGSSWGPALDLAVPRHEEGPGLLCLPRALTMDAEALVSCEVEIVLNGPDAFGGAARCEAYGLEYVGTELDETSGLPAEHCTMPQVERSAYDPSAAAWAYEEGSFDAEGLCIDGPQAIRVSPSRFADLAELEITVRCELPIPEGGPPPPPECAD